MGLIVTNCFNSHTGGFIPPFIMFKAIQPSINLWDRKEKYNGWSDWTTWNAVSYTHLTLPTTPYV